MREQTGGQGVDVVLEMSGAPSAIQQSLRLVRPGGRVSLMGIPSREVSLKYRRGRDFQGRDYSRRRGPQTLRYVVHDEGPACVRQIGRIADFNPPIAV